MLKLLETKRLYFYNSLAPRLYKHCKDDAKRLCDVSGWSHRPHNEKEAPPDALVFSCLYKHKKTRKV